VFAEAASAHCVLSAVAFTALFWVLHALELRARNRRDLWRSGPRLVFMSTAKASQKIFHWLCTCIAGPQNSATPSRNSAWGMDLRERARRDAR
jgi:hypothetical protein